MNRRDFFMELSGGAPPEQSTASARFPAVQTGGSPRQYRAGTCVLVEDARAWLCRDAIGFYAIDAHCPYLGCLVRPVEAGFLRPCHQSRFSAAGECVAGPARHGLRYRYIDLDDAGQLMIHRNRSADPNDRLVA